MPKVIGRSRADRRMRGNGLYLYILIKLNQKNKLYLFVSSYSVSEGLGLYCFFSMRNDWYSPVLHSACT